MRKNVAALAAAVTLVTGCMATSQPESAPAPAPPRSTPASAVPASSAAAPLEAPGRFSFEGRMEQGGLVIGTAPAGTDRLSLDGRPVWLGPEGRFVLGFDRDQRPRATLAAELADGRVVSEDLRIAPRLWQIEHINLALRQGVSSEAYRRIREGELARIASARAAATPSQGWQQRFVWPTTGRISGRFGSQRIYRGEPAAFHSGVDVAAGAGTSVVAPADGVVVLSPPPRFSLEGNLVIIDHGMGLNSAFLHLKDSNVREGQAVKQGQLIGRVGATGRATGPHLHWSMKWQDARIDPQPVAGAMRD